LKRIVRGVIERAVGKGGGRGTGDKVKDSHPFYGKNERLRGDERKGTQNSNQTSNPSPRDEGRSWGHLYTDTEIIT